jgi:8-hydroxy-5-deazaflavin:NADPH oxidoreductase
VQRAARTVHAPPALTDSGATMEVGASDSSTATDQAVQKSALDATTVAVIGTGAYGTSFAQRLARSGVNVVAGSRNPSAAGANAHPWATETWDVASVDAAVSQATVVVLAIPHDAYAGFVSDHSAALLSGPEKILVDVCNPVTPGFASCARAVFARARGDKDTVLSGRESSAQRLQAALGSLGGGKSGPSGLATCHVVKAFNTVSAFELDSQYARSPPPVVTASGDSVAAKATVLNLARRMGFAGLDFGGLPASHLQEQTVHRFFDGWVAATVVSTIVALLITLYYSNIYWAGKKEKATKFWMSWALLLTGDISTTLLCACYLPGCIAGFWQLARGTSKRPFPAWFASWMNIRKQFGIIAFGFAACHAIAGALHGAPMEMDGEVPKYADYTYLAFGAFAFVVFAILAASTGTVAAQGQMSWMEFKFVFGTLGFLTQALLLVHLAYLVPGWVEWMKTPESWSNKVILLYWSVGILSLTMLPKIALSVPPLSILLAKVRSRK